jgi:hypothetical protein
MADRIGIQIAADVASARSNLRGTAEDIRHIGAAAAHG